MLAVGREPTRQAIEDGRRHPGRWPTDQTDRPRGRADACDQAVQRELAADAGGCDSRQKERPVEWVPGADLEVGQEGKAGEDIRGPERQVTASQRIRKVALRSVVHVDS